MGERCFEFAIVGAGASGLAAAGETVQAGSTIVLEAGKKPGRKLLATGNGRCNLGNRRISPERYHGDVPRAARVLERFPAEKLEQFWRKNGLLCRELDEGRLYPYGLQASTVLECLLRRVVQRGGELRCEFPVEEIRREQGFLTLSGPAGQVRARRVILACGGFAIPRWERRRVSSGVRSRSSRCSDFSLPGSSHRSGCTGQAIEGCAQSGGNFTLGGDARRRFFSRRGAVYRRGAVRNLCFRGVPSVWRAQRGRETCSGAFGLFDARIRPRRYLRFSSHSGSFSAAARTGAARRNDEPFGCTRSPENGGARSAASCEAAQTGAAFRYCGPRARFSFSDYRDSRMGDSAGNRGRRSALGGGRFHSGITPLSRRVSDGRAAQR